MLGNKFKTSFFAIIFLSLLFTCCTKNVAGPKGDPGTPGKSGNVIQTHTKAFVQPPSAWTKLEFDWESVIYVAEMTKSVLEKGEVKVYVQIGTDWYDLPYAEGLFVTQCRFEQGMIYLKYYNTHTAIPERPTARTYRVVVFSPVQ